MPQQPAQDPAQSPGRHTRAAESGNGSARYRRSPARFHWRMLGLSFGLLLIVPLASAFTAALVPRLDSLLSGLAGVSVAAGLLGLVIWCAIALNRFLNP